MGTQSNLYIEEEDGSFIGVYCKYDGYPEHMLKQIKYCNFSSLYDSILVAGTRGGYRLFSPTTNETEFLNHDMPHYVYDPDDDGALGIDYIYAVKRDGTIKWRQAMSNKWNIMESEE